jgi:hypothetical protein
MATGYPVALFLILAVALDAQPPVLTQTVNEPKPGDIEHYYAMDTSAFTVPLPTNAGAGQSWDFTKLKAFSGINTFSYLAASAVPASSAFAGCTMVQYQPLFNNYMRSATTPTTQTEVLGIESGSLTVTFTNSAIMIKFPASFGVTYTDTIAGGFKAGAYNGECDGDIVFSADATGTLHLPNGVKVNDVLRVKSVQSMTFTLFFPVGSARQIVYSYFSFQERSPVLMVSYQEITLGSGTPSVTSSIFGSPSVFTDVEERSSFPGDIRVFPVPASDALHISSLPAEAAVVRIRDISGRIVVEVPSSATTDISGLEPGVYFVELPLAGRTLRKRFLKL